MEALFRTYLTASSTVLSLRREPHGRGGFQTRPYVFSGPSMVPLVIADHCIIATFSQTGHMAVENNPGGLGDSLMVMVVSCPRPGG